MLSVVGEQAGRRRALTLVELLVVIAIIGVLVALLLPAIQAARETARRSQCQNNLKQIALGLSSFETVHATFPIGCIGCYSGNKEMNSWNAQLLPFIEQHSLAASYELSSPSYALPNRKIGATIIPLFLCPSTIEERLYSESTLWFGQAFSDYGAIYGVEGDGTSATSDSSKQPIDDLWLGVFIYNVPVATFQISDGLSHTVGVAERLLRRSTTSEWPCGQNIFAQEKNTPLNQQSGRGNEIGSPHPGGALLTFCDSHVAFVTDEIEQAVLNAMLTKAGGETP